VRRFTLLGVAAQPIPYATQHLAWMKATDCLKMEEELSRLHKTRFASGELAGREFFGQVSIFQMNKERNEWASRAMSCAFDVAQAERVPKTDDWAGELLRKLGGKSE